MHSNVWSFRLSISDSSLVNLISPGTGHVVDPKTHAEQMKRIAEYADRAPGGPAPSPAHIRFVTWTLKYNRCHWIRILGLEKHYKRAELDATIQ